MAGSQRSYRCDRIRRNNGVVEYFFSRRNGDQDEHVLINITSVTAPNMKKASTT